MESLHRAGLISNSKNPIIGFLDESSIRSDPGRRRVLCTHIIRYDEGSGKRSKTIFGFMAINGNDVAMVSDTSKAGDMASFLQLIRQENSVRPIVMILDNAKIHRASATIKAAEDLGIILTFLPPYSPDLNPIELGWKDVKRELGGILQFDMAAAQAKPITLQLFRERKSNYSSYWVERIIND